MTSSPRSLANKRPDVLIRSVLCEYWQRNWRFLAADVRSGAFWTISLHFSAVLCRKVIESHFDVTENKTDCELGIEVTVETSSSGVIGLTCGALVHLVDALSYKQLEGRDSITVNFYWHNPSGRSMALGSTQPIRDSCTRNISWGSKGGRCVGLTTLPPSCADCVEIWGVPNSWNPQGLNRSEQESLYLFNLRCDLSDGERSQTHVKTVAVWAENRSWVLPHVNYGCQPLSRYFS